MYSDYYNYNNYSGYSNYDYGVVSGITAGLIIFWIFFLTIILAVSVVQIIAMWKIFKKAGKKGWEAIIPFYNTWTLFEVCGYPGYYLFFAFIPCFGGIVLLVFKILAYISLTKKFKKDSGFAVLLILLPVIGFSILGFGKDTYDSSLGEQKNTSPINEPSVEEEVKETKTTNSTTKTTSTTTKAKEENKFCGNCGKKVSKSATACPNCGNKLK